ncbi:MAG TPA: SURF1 family protein [Steroidobacteraceae bacterium]|nr:SURF1 family protein [Steroidobacteraceae bacterium]
MTIRFGTREFAPRTLMTLLTVVVFASLVALGRWQVRRAAETQTLWDEFAAGADAAVTIDARTPQIRQFEHVRLTGRYDPAHQILIDGMEGPAGRNGYYVLTPFEFTGGGWILVDRGWIPLQGDPQTKPSVPVSGATRTVVGRADELPRPGIRLGGGQPLGPPFPVVALYPRLTDIAKLLHVAEWAPAAQQVLLDPGQPDGYYRHWSPPGFPPIRHTAYAVQWFLLAATLLVIYVVTNLRPLGGRKAKFDG